MAHTMSTTMFFPRARVYYFIIVLALLSLSAIASPTAPTRNLLRNNGCNNNIYPLADPNHHHHHHVTVPNDERSYAPLCPDGRHIDMRRLQSCPIGQCYAIIYQSCMYDQGATCQSQQQSNNNQVSMTLRHEGDGDDHDDPADQCMGGQCYSKLYRSCFHVLSSECLNPPTAKPTMRTTLSPTSKPTFALEQTEHNVELTLGNVAPSYKLTMEARALIIRFAKMVIEENLKEPLELIEVTFGGYLVNRRLSQNHDSILGGGRRLELSVPLKVTLQGPTNMRDFALSFIMDILQEDLSGLIGELKNQDYEAFEDVELSTGTYSASDIMEETDQPTGKPTPAPTPPPFVEMEETVHPVSLFFMNMPDGYVMTEEMRAAIIRFVKTLMNDYLDERLEILDVSYAGILIEDTWAGVDRAAQALPLLFTLWGPLDISALAPVLIMEVLDDNMRELGILLSSLDGEVLIDVSLAADTYDLADIVYATKDPTGRPSTMGPTGRPTFRRVEVVHPVKLVFGKAPPGYKFSKKHRLSMMEFLKKLLDDKLDKELKCTKISSAVDVMEGRMRRHLSRFLQGSDAPELALLINVEAPEDIPPEFALEAIMAVIDDNMDDLEDFLMEKIDADVFEDPDVTVETFDPDNYPEPALVPMRPMETEEEEGLIVPWWAWLLFGVGILALSCFCCFCCRSLCRYQTHNDEFKDYSKEEKVVETQIVEKPVYIETPVYIEKPIIIEQIRDRPRKEKKQKKKKKRKSKVPKMLQIDQQKVLEIEHDANMFQIGQESTVADGPVIAVHNRPSDMTARSHLTFDYDPPSDNYSQMEGQHSYHGRLLAPVDPSLAQICEEPSAAYSVGTTRDEPSAAYSIGYSTRDSYSGECLAIENQTQYTQDPSVNGWNDGTIGSQAHYSKDEPSANGWDPSVAGESYYGGNEPSGHEYADTQSYASRQQEQPSYASRASTQHGWDGTDVSEHASRASTRASKQSYSTQHNPSGHGWAGVQSHGVSQHSEQPSHASRASTRASKRASKMEPPSHATQTQKENAPKLSRERKSSIFATFDDPLFTTEAQDSTFTTSFPDKRRHTRRQSGGIESEAGSSFAYSETTHQTTPM